MVHEEDGGEQVVLDLQQTQEETQAGQELSEAERQVHGM
jgi:hypothetical protein